MNNGIQFLKYQRFKQCKLIIKEALGKIEPLLALVLMVALVLGLRLIGEMLVVPSQYSCISYLLRDQVKKFDMHGCGLCKRG